MIVPDAVIQLAELNPVAAVGWCLLVAIGFTLAAFLIATKG